MNKIKLTSGAEVIANIIGESATGTIICLLDPKTGKWGLDYVIIANSEIKGVESI